MSIWMEAKRTLTAMDLVTRDWGRQLALDECGVMVLILLGTRDSCRACDLAALCGRARQQVQRSLMMMKERELVCPAELSEHGRTVGWKLTELGVEYWRALEPALYEWDEVLAEQLDVVELTRLLSRTAEIMVNRRSIDGWRRALLVPSGQRLCPVIARLELALTEKEHANLPPEEGLADTK